MKKFNSLLIAFITLFSINIYGQADSFAACDEPCGNIPEVGASLEATGALFDILEVTNQAGQPGAVVAAIPLFRFFDVEVPFGCALESVSFSFKVENNSASQPFDFTHTDHAFFNSTENQACHGWVDVTPTFNPLESSLERNVMPPPIPISGVVGWDISGGSGGMYQVMEEHEIPMVGLSPFFHVIENGFNIEVRNVRFEYTCLGYKTSYCWDRQMTDNEISYHLPVFEDSKRVMKREEDFRLSYSVNPTGIEIFTFDKILENASINVYDINGATIANNVPINGVRASIPTSGISHRICIVNVVDAQGQVIHSQKLLF